MSCPIGTILRCPTADERRIEFYHSLGMTAMQIAGVMEDWLAPTAEAIARSEAIMTMLRERGISTPTMFLSFPNQDWAHPVEGVGLSPLKTRAERMILACRQMNWGKKYGVHYVTCHVGYFPEESTDEYKSLINDLKLLVRFAKANGQDFLFETGMENVPTLKRIFNDIGEDNLGLNFDPANLLIYGSDEPAHVVEEMGDLVKVIHCKDARHAAPTEKAGKETPLGKGDTDFANLLKSLLARGFAGPLIIERELPLGPEQEKDVAEAVILIQNIIKGAKQ